MTKSEKQKNADVEASLKFLKTLLSKKDTPEQVKKRKLDSLLIDKKRESAKLADITKKMKSLRTQADTIKAKLKHINSNISALK